MGNVHINPADISPGYQFQVGFTVSAPEVASVEAVQNTIAARLGIPDEHNFGIMEVPPAQDQAARLHRFLGGVTFIDWDHTEVLRAQIHVEVLEPGIVTRGIAWLFRRQPNSSVWAMGDGTKPFGEGGGVRPDPDIPPLPVRPQGDLLRV
jgi:hypothetical protein